MSSTGSNQNLSTVYTIPNSNCEKSSIGSSEDIEIRTYKRRWFVVAVLSLLVFSNSMSRIAYGPVAYTSATFYHSDVSVINWFAIVYMIVGIPCGLIATWVMEKIGLRYSLLLAAWIHCAGCIIRVMSALPAFEISVQIALVFLGHILSAMAQPFLMFAPTKVAAIWFPENQRALANTVVTTSNPLGIMAANILSPLLVKSPDDILMMLVIYAVPAGIGALLVTFGMRRSAPEYPPSASARKKSEPFWIGIKKLIHNVQFWILFLSIGGGIGIYTSLTVFLEQMLCPWGYTDFFAGVVCGTCLVIAGVLGAVIGGLIADKTKQFAVVSKVSYILCIGSVAFFSFVQNLQNRPILVAVSCSLIGFFGMPLLPLGNELVVETTYPVDAATSSGIVFLSGQLQGMLLILALQNVAQPISADYENITRCRAEEMSNTSGTWDNKPIKIQNMTVPCYVLLGYSCFVCIVFVLFFYPANRRINMERRAARNAGRCPPSTSIENSSLNQSSFSSEISDERANQPDKKREENEKNTFSQSQEKLQ